MERITKKSLRVAVGATAFFVMGWTAAFADVTTVAVGDTFDNSRTTATWIGGGSDSLMTTLSNWQGSPASLDLTAGTVDVDIRAGGEMKYSGATWLASITNSIAFVAGGVNTPFWIVPETENDKLVLSGGLRSPSGKGQIVLKGHIALPEGVSGGSASSSSNPYRITYAPAAWRTTAATVPSGIIEGVHATDGTTYGSAPLVLAGVSVFPPMSVNGVASAASILGYTGTSNVVNGAFWSGASQSAVAVMSGATIDFRGGFSPDWAYRIIGTDNFENPGVVRITGTAVQWPQKSSATSAGNKTLTVQRKAHLIFDAENCYLRGGLLNESGLIEFARSGCFRDGTTQLSENFHTQFYTTRIEFNATTQRFSMVTFYNTNANSWFHGNYPAMMEVTCELFGTTTGVSSNAIPINGGLGIHVCGNGTFPLARQNYASCGDLEASAGTLMLCSDATWLNGTNFTARGTGCLKFTKAGQVNSDFAKIRLADSGTIEIPAGVTLAVQSLEVLSDGKWKVVDSPKKFDASAKGLMSGRIVGGGSLRVLGNRAGGFVVLLK